MKPPFMRAISIRSPWWWFILHGGKDIENRSRPFNYQGPLLIHAGCKLRQPDFEEDYIFGADLMRTGREKLKAAHQMIGEMAPSCGHIVGVVMMHETVSFSTSRWFQGEYGYEIYEPGVFLEPIPWKGKQGIMHVPVDVVADQLRKIGRGHMASAAQQEKKNG